METKGSKMETNGNYTQNVCCQICNKVYANRGGLWKHTHSKRGCKIEPLNELDILKKEIELLKDQITHLKQQNDKLFHQNENLTNTITELSQKSYSIQTGACKSNNETTTNKFNLNFYLNETCKNAISLEKFVEKYKSNQPQFYEYLNHNLANGFASNIITNLKKYKQIERPIQLVDKTRKHFYYKLNDKWIENTNPLNEGEFNKFLDKLQIKEQRLLFEYRKNYKEENEIKNEYDDKECEKIDIIMTKLFDELTDDVCSQIITKIIKECPVDKK